MPPYYLGPAYLVQGKEEAVRWLERAFEERSFQLTVIRLDALFDPLRDRPRFQALLEKYGEEAS